MPGKPMPWWVKVLIVAVCLPLASLPWLMAGNVETDTGKILLRFYPLFVPLNAVCAWRAWRRTPEITWILILLMLLTHAAMWLLCYPPEL